MSPTGDILYQPPHESNLIGSKLAEYLRDVVVLSPGGAVMVNAPGTESLDPPPPNRSAATDAMHAAWQRLKIDTKDAQGRQVSM